MSRLERDFQQAGAVAFAFALVAVCLPGEAEIQRGKALYEANCLTCHGGSTGGDLRDVPPPHNANGHTWHHADCLIIELALNGIENPQAPPEAPQMPAFRGRLSEQDLGEIVAYLKTWWTEDQRAWQSQVTRQSCS